MKLALTQMLDEREERLTANRRLGNMAGQRMYSQLFSGRVSSLICFSSSGRIKDKQLNNEL